LISGGVSGANQKIGIVTAYGSSTIQKDLNTFCTTFGLPATQIQIVYPQGQPTQTDAGWKLETSLDVEWAHAIAPGAGILLVVAKSPVVSSLLTCVNTAVQGGANQVSMSWGNAEFSGQVSFDHTFNVSGVSFFAASGDKGAGAQWPASSPYVVGVGGTTLKNTSSVYSEVAWSGSGGGISAYETRPTFQIGWQSARNRGVPDVSFDANPSTGVAVYSGGWTVVGGTSAGSPQWAGIAALVNSRRKALGKTPVSRMPAALYSAAAAAYSGNFYDVTVGNDGGFNAGAKYDYVTGLGSPHVGNLTASLAAQ
jgi:subtilase family serine protease